MQSFGKTVQGVASALGLGLLTTTGLATVTLVTAPAAVAQAKSSETFVLAYRAAKDAVAARDWTGALSKADQAAAAAKTQQEKVAVEAVRVQAYHGKGDKNGLIKSLETLSQLDPSQAAKNRDTLMGLYASTNPAKAEEMMKANVGALTSQQLGFLADRALKARDYQNAIKYGQLAIEKSRAEGKKPSANYYNIKLKAFQDTKALDGYYKTLEEAAPMFPDRADIYFRPLIDRATKDPKFNRASYQLDLFRAYAAAKVPLKTDEKVMMAEAAFNRKMAVEAEQVVDPLVKDGTIGGPKDGKAERNKRMVAQIQADAKAAKAGSLKAAETAAGSAPTGLQLVEVGEGYMGLGDYKKAAELIQKGIAKGQLKPEDEAFAKVRLGMAQYRSGQKDAARATWQSIKSDSGAESLARAWVAISKT